ncbi:nitrogenase iron protein [Geobacter sp. SVR]|uniref:nucleotide-binding protein n=1 Tax=Geobacter sp. SVR TaxID=2495594 RepID=UPI00143F052B|nr:nitrogenase iron protein [Geobacter sp. SVR]BCS54139.1 nitrogenase iron protein [Geobacter sp. SVR]GCF87701.1 nitrogenase iron protein [Geobacter sp. SVR]
MTEHIVLYGKGGVGSSTLTSNITAALVEAGFRVLQIGCGPKADSCSMLNKGCPVPTVWDEYAGTGRVTFDSVVTRGFKGAFCIEFGRPRIKKESAAALALDQLLEHGLITALLPDFVLYDISGDHDGFLHALAEKITVKRIFAVTTADFMSLAAVNDILVQLERFRDSHVPVPVGGLLPNSITCSFEESFISDFARNTHTRTLAPIPRSLVVRQCELHGRTVIEASPLSNQSYFYRRLANQIVDECNGRRGNGLPQPMRPEQLREWARAWGNRLHALDNGLVTDGAAI